jgi:hypothetical protein
MATNDELYFDLMKQILAVLKRLRIEQDFSDPNFESGSGELIYSTFLRAIGFLRYSEEIEQQIFVSKQVERGKNIVDKILKVKTSEAEQRRLLLLNFLKSLLKQIEKYVRDVNLTQIKRIRKQIGNPVVDPRNDSKISTTPFTGDIAVDVELMNTKFQEFDQNRDNFGQLVLEIDLLSSLTGNLSALIQSLFQETSTTPGSQPLGPIGGPFVSLIRSQTIGYEQRLDRLTNRRVALNAQLILLQDKMQFIRTGTDIISRQPIALLSILDALVYLFSEVKYTCKQCRFYSTTPAEVDLALTANLTEEEKLVDQRRLEEAQQRASNIQKELRTGDQTGFCTFRAANLPSVDSGSCLSVWNLLGNDFWTASDNDQDGREDVVTKAKDKLDPRKR